MNDPSVTARTLREARPDVLKQLLHDYRIVQLRGGHPTMMDAVHLANSHEFLGDWLNRLCLGESGRQMLVAQKVGNQVPVERQSVGGGTVQLLSADAVSHRAYSSSSS